MFNKRKKAIDALNKHLTDLSTISNVRDGNNWKASLMDTLNLYIGVESFISKRLGGLYFTRREDIYDSRDLGILAEHIYDESKKDNFRDLIQNAIKYIDANGIYKNETRRNLLGSFKNGEIISGIVVATGIVFGIGNYLGKLEKDRDIIENEEKIRNVTQQDEELKKENQKLKLDIHTLTSNTKIYKDTTKVHSK